MIKGSLNYYKELIIPALKSKFNYSNVMQVPSIEKVILNMGIGEAKNNKNIVVDAVKAMTSISGQKPQTCLSKKSIAGFKIRDNMEIGVKVTLRRRAMYNFLTKMIHIQLPRVKDFNGLPRDKFDNFGNYTFGITDASIFVELSKFHSQLVKGLSITVVTSAKSSEEALALLEESGFPFQKKKT